MRVIAGEPTRIKPIVLRIDLKLLKKLDILAKQADVSRQVLISRILDQVIRDHRFTLKFDK